MFSTFLTALWVVMLELAPWLLLGAVVAGALHVFLPVGFVHRRLRGPRGIFEAVALGVPLPLCSCGVIPAGLGLKKDGASNGASIAFLTATPQTGVDSILVSASFLGWPFALFKVAVAGLTGVIGGFVTDAVAGPGADDAPPPPVDEKPRGVRDGLDHAVEILQNIWGWLVFGVVVSALITTLVPPSAFAGFASLGPVGAALVVLVISIPLYVCATASVPIAAALVAGGMPVGAALVFLLAGPATNVATVGAVYRGFGGRVLAVYLVNIIVGSVLGAWAFESMFDISSVVTAGGHDHVTWWAGASAVFLTAVILKFAYEDLRLWWTARTGSPAPTAQVLEIRVDGMSCGGCVKKLTGRLQDAAGVDSVEVTLEPGTAVVRGLISNADARRVIEDAGFRAVG
jgi:uncharacterized membrane protein YraQ (UPF0718 family)/copper chaperone CopZ